MVITILSNATLHNELAVKHYQQDLPKSQKYPDHYKKVELKCIFNIDL